MSRCLSLLSTEEDKGALNFSLVRALASPYDAPVQPFPSDLKALCVGRHPFLAEHFSRFFGDLGLSTRPAVGLTTAVLESREFDPDVVICEYELLTSLSLEDWEHDELLSRRPVIAVSMSRRPHEPHMLDVNSIAGFLYLPLLAREAAVQVIGAAASAVRKTYTPSPPGIAPIESLAR
ncbi:MAG TPA: hypothetical protein VHM24_14565 [Gemmatimonadaceae bacterium]|nr:hypothetical protein [Gemmatimonadaceae bacterium]